MEPKRLLKVGLLVLLLPCALCLALQIGCNPSAQMHTAKYNYLILKLWSDRSRARVGEPVRIRFTITNEGGDTWIESPTTPVMDISVKVVGGPRLLTWSSQNPDKVQHRIEWRPGETKTIEWAWVPKPEDIAYGYYQDVFLTGLLYQDGEIIQSAGVTVCASNYCRR
jgi:hypothetical protein